MRHARLVPAAAGLLLYLASACMAAAQELPRVRLVATGGTISNRTGGRLTADELINLAPDVRRYARPEAEQFSNTASSDLTLGQWLALSRRLNELYSTDAALAGIVVTSGTDTLEELAYFLHLTVRDARPVVVVGSMRNPSTTGYEGAANLLEGFRVAASPEARGKGVLVVLNDEINSAREVTKTDALRLQTFQSRTTGVLGVVDPDRVVFYRGVVKRHTSASEFDVVDDLRTAAGRRAARLPGRAGRPHQGRRRSRRSRARRSNGGRRRDQRNPVRRPRVRHRQGRDRGGDHAGRQRPDLRHPDVRLAVHRRRGPGADQGPDPAHAGPGDREEPRRHPAHVPGVLVLTPGPGSG